MLFAKKTNADTTTLIDIRDAIASELANHTPGTTEHKELLAQLIEAQKLVEKDPNPSWTFKPSADVIVTGLITLICTFGIIKHEQFAVLTSKAFGFLPKLMK